MRCKTLLTKLNRLRLGGIGHRGHGKRLRIGAYGEFGLHESPLAGSMVALGLDLAREAANHSIAEALQEDAKSDGPGNALEAGGGAEPCSQTPGEHESTQQSAEELYKHAAQLESESVDAYKEMVQKVLNSPDPVEGAKTRLRALGVQIWHGIPPSFVCDHVEVRSIL